MFYTNTFATYGGKRWICPNTDTIELSNYLTMLELDIYSCSKSKIQDEGRDTMTPYASEDEECLNDGVIPADLGLFEVSTMLVSDTFNPKIYHEKGFIQTTSRFDGEYQIGPNGNYINRVQLNDYSY